MEIGEAGVHGQAVKVCLEDVTDPETDLATILLHRMEDHPVEVLQGLLQAALDVQVKIT